MQHILIDDQFRPLYRVVWRGEPTDAELESYLAAMRADMLRSDATMRILIQDSRGAPGLNAAQRRVQAEWVRENEALIRQRTICVVFVMSSTLLRGMLTAILWFQPLPVPHHVFGSMEEALEFCEQRLAQLNYPLPKGVREAWGA